MIHKFIFNGARLVFDVHSGSLHVVDEPVWDLLDSSCRCAADDDSPAGVVAGYGPGVIAEARSEIRCLIEKGLLFSADPLGGSYTPPRDSVVKALCLHLAHDCNLACRYCFAGQGKFGGAAGLMPPEVGRRALELLMEASGARRRLEVDFFGGEPLLNFEVLKMLVDYGEALARERGKEIHFTVTTNAVLLDRRVGEFLNSRNLSVVLSLDGRPGVHDAMRPFAGGQGSYQRVLKNIKSFLASRDYQDYQIRGTYTAYNTDFFRDAADLISRGFDNISLEPVVCDPGEDYALREEHLGQAATQYELLARHILDLRRQGRRVNFFHFNIDLDGGPCLPKRMSGCGAGHQYLAVDPSGVLFPCHQFVGHAGFAMGDVYSGVRRPDLADRFRNAHLYRREGCPGCWAKYLCSGGCHAGAYFYGGSLEKAYGPACGLIKKRLEAALYLYANLQPEGDNQGSNL